MKIGLAILSHDFPTSHLMKVRPNVLELFYSYSHADWENTIGAGKHGELKRPGRDVWSCFTAGWLILTAEAIVIT
jgi:hypothetical protein